MLSKDNLIDLNAIKFQTTCKPISRIFILLTIPTALLTLVIFMLLRKVTFKS